MFFSFIFRIKHSKSNLYSAKANLDTIDNAVRNQLSKSLTFFRRDEIGLWNAFLANVRLTGVMQKSAEIAQSLSELMKVEQMQAVSQQFSQELMKVRERFLRLYS